MRCHERFLVACRIAGCRPLKQVQNGLCFQLDLFMTFAFLCLYLHTFFTFAFAFLFIIPQSSDTVSLWLTSLCSVEGVHDKGAFMVYIPVVKLLTSVKFFLGGWFSFLIFPARHAEHGVSLSKSLSVSCCMCKPSTFPCVWLRT